MRILIRDLAALLAVLAALLAPALAGQTVAAPRGVLAEPPPPVRAPDLSALSAVEVVGVTDGDTITVLRDGREDKVRLLGVDTPETKDPRQRCSSSAPSRPPS